MPGTPPFFYLESRDIPLNLDAFDLPLGKAVAQPETFAAELLAPVPRAWSRQREGVSLDGLSGTDIWNLWELGWLNLQGRPVQAVGRMSVPFDTPFLIESKSLKLYFNSMNNHRFESFEAVCSTARHDLSQAADGPVELQLWPVGEGDLSVVEEPVTGHLIDQADWLPDYTLGPDIIVGPLEHRVFICHTFRSLCPLTAQPDWATIVIDYKGGQIDPSRLLAYLCSYRNHRGFHEACCEKIAADLLVATHADSLSVEARFLRRGGIDINPVRTTDSDQIAHARWSRQ